MQIIFVHSKLKQAKTLTLTKLHLFVTLGVLLFFFGISSGVLSYAAVNFAIHTRIPQIQSFVQSVVGGASAKDVASKDQFFRQNIDALASKLGQLQAQMTRIDAIGERVATMTGIKPADLPKAADLLKANSDKGLAPAPTTLVSRAGSGGPFVPSGIPTAESLYRAGQAGGSLEAIAATIDQIAQTLDQRADYLALVESEMLLQTVRAKILPTNQPLPDGNMGSRFGYRSDPFTNRSAMHEGIDFNAPTGTPIFAAGGGKVIVAGVHNSYGNHVDLDHGGGLVTRYAHASKLLVKEGDIVKQGQKIAEVGSTGRSTGAHLHFEVRINEEAQDTLKYLQAGFIFSKELAKR